MTGEREEGETTGTETGRETGPETEIARGETEIGEETGVEIAGRETIIVPVCRPRDHSGNLFTVNRLP